MKKLFISLLCAAAVLPATANVVTFKSETSSYQPMNAGEEVVNIPMTWTGRTMYCDAINLYIGGGTSKDSSRGGFIGKNKGKANGAYAAADQLYVQVNPVSGVKVTKVTISAYNAAGTLDEMVETTEGQYRILTWTGECESTLETDGKKRFYLHIDPAMIVETDGEKKYAASYKAEEIRMKNITIEYEGTPLRSALPKSNVDDYYMTSKPVVLTCSEPGAKIYYSIAASKTFNNGFTATPADDEGFVEYKEPFIISEPVDLMAYSYVEGKKKSGLFYRYVYPAPEDTEMATFNISDPKSLGQEGTCVLAMKNVVLPLNNNGITLSHYSDASKEANGCRIMNTIAYGEEFDLRHAADNAKNYNKMIFTTENEADEIMAIYLIGNEVNSHFCAAKTSTKAATATYTFPDLVDYENADSENYTQKIFKQTVSGNAGQYIAKWQQNSDYEGDASTNNLIFDHFNTGSASTINRIHVFYKKNGEASVKNIVIDENAPVEFYNLQGIKVSGNEPGLYIRRQGSKATKVLVK